LKVFYQDGHLLSTAPDAPHGGIQIDDFDGVDSIGGAFLLIRHGFLSVRAMWCIASVLLAITRKV
jgi:hypothetical protein